MRIRGLFFTAILIGIHYLATIQTLFMQLACSAKAALPAPSAWACSMGAAFEWALLTPVLALPDLFPGLELTAPVLAACALFNSMLQVLFVEATAELLLLARAWRNRARIRQPERLEPWLHAPAPLGPPPFSAGRPGTPPPFRRSLSRQQRAPSASGS